jgi:hypothetical protein
MISLKRRQEIKQRHWKTSCAGKKKYISKRLHGLKSHGALISKLIAMSQLTSRVMESIHSKYLIMCSDKLSDFR